MKSITLAFCFLHSLPLFAQKHPIDFDWPKPRVIGGLFYVFSLGENGTVFYEQDVRSPMSADMKIAYILADGKTSWIANEVKNMTIDCDVVWDDASFTIYNKNSKKKMVEFWHFAYKGKMTSSGESKFEYPVLSIFRSGEKQTAILESDKKQLKKLYIQELTPKTFVPAELKSVSAALLDVDESGLVNTTQFITSPSFQLPGYSVNVLEIPTH